jgi:hypothetical protein
MPPRLFLIVGEPPRMSVAQSRACQLNLAMWSSGSRGWPRCDALSYCSTFVTVGPTDSSRLHQRRNSTTDSSNESNFNPFRPAVLNPDV